MANVLTDRLPCELCGVPVETGFRAWLQYEALLLDSSKTADQIIAGLNALVYRGKMPADKAEAVRAATDFYLCGKPQERRKNGHRAAKRAYDIDVDAPLFLAAFQQVYGIDLSTCELHWWKFRSMLSGLPEECQLSKVISYRTVDLSKVPKEKRKFYTEMQKRYALNPIRQHTAKPATLAERDAAYLAKMNAKYQEAVNHG